MRSLLFLLILTSLISCADPSDQLVGNWVATSVILDEQTVDIDLSLVGFEFDENGKYSFNSTLDYREAGVYEVVDNKLMTKDTINGQGKKSVLIDQMDSDTLKLRMKNPEGWMELTLARE